MRTQDKQMTDVEPVSDSTLGGVGRTYFVRNARTKGTNIHPVSRQADAHKTALKIR
jgi:hypothetical protein